MKKSKIIAGLCAMLLIATSTIGCGSTSDTNNNSSNESSTSESSPAKQQTLSVWVTNALVADSEQKKPQDQWYFSKVCKEFEAQNPGVKVQFTLQSDATAVPQMVKAAALSGSGPDIVNLWAGQCLFDLKDVLLDITPYISEGDKKVISGWDTTTVDFKEGNPILGYPICGTELTGFIYNKKVLKQVGLDFDKNPPKTIDELMSDLQKIKDAGYTPIVASDGGWNGGFFMGPASWWVQTSGSKRVSSNSTGMTKYSDDQGFLDAYALGAKIYKAGYINKDYATQPNPSQVFYAGKSALFLTGSWDASNSIEALGKDNVGFVNLPDISSNVKVKGTCIGGPGQALAVANYSKNQELAVKFCSFVDNRKNMIDLIGLQAKLPLRSDISLKDLGWDGISVYSQLDALSKNYVYWADNSTKSSTLAVMQKLGVNVITGKMTPQELAAELDKAAAKK